MPDDSLACMLGRMEQKIEDIKADIKEIKDEQKRLATYVDTQKIGIKVLVGMAAAAGSIAVFFKEQLIELIFGKVPT